MKIYKILFFLYILNCFPLYSSTSWTKDYNVVWTTQSKNSWESMPCGGGSLGLNVWVENNDLYLLLASPDSWMSKQNDHDNEKDRQIIRSLVKLGRLHLKFTEGVFQNGFKQELDLATNSIIISGINSDNKLMNIRIWVNNDNPVVYIDGESDFPIEVEAAVETWRGRTHFEKGSIIWSYKNDPLNDDARNYYIKSRNLEEIASAIPDVLSNLTFGGILSGKDFIASNIKESKYDTIPCKSYSIKTKKPIKKFQIQTTISVTQCADYKKWEKDLKTAEKQLLQSKDKAWEKVISNWKNRWESSYIIINHDRGVEDIGWQVGRNYQLFRAMLAANSKGKYPTLFNGGLFICESDPDIRNWYWSEFMAQNQRLVYWPMLKSGDVDLLDIALNYYKDRTPVAEAWAKHFWGIDGHMYTEDMNVFGLPCYMNTPDGHSSPECLQYHYVSGMEFALMMLERCRFTGKDITPYIKSIEGILRGYDGFYRKKNKELTGNELNQRGLYEIYPSNSLELYTNCRNDVATISALSALADGLLTLSEKSFNGSNRTFVQDFRRRLPAISKRVIHEHLTIAPAETWEGERPASNMEFPHLYPVFPFGYYGVGKPDLQIARDTWEYGYYISPEFQRRTFCWYQGNIFTARLGLTDEAKEYALAKFLYPLREKKKSKIEGIEEQWFDANLTPMRTRFPAFFDTGNFCQAPDFDHGGSAMVGLQEMLMQTDLPSPDGNGGYYGRKIYLLPAWPKDWDVKFKLHAPYQTIVECEVKNGKIIKLEVTPKEREKDIVKLGTFFE